MWVKLQRVLYNLDYIISVFPVKNSRVEEIIKDYEHWYFTILFSDGTEENIKYEHKEDALTDYSKIERKCIKWY